MAVAESDEVTQSALASLRRFMRPRPPREQCDLCGAALAAEHAHLVEVATRRLHCACDACAILFSGSGAGRYRRVPRNLQLLEDFELTDAQWDSLGLPIRLAFFFHNSGAGRVVATYPSPAGATEAVPDAETWNALAERNPVLRELEPDVEALLVNRLGQAPIHYRVGIDECYKLVGIIRAHWRGLSGGTEVWREIETFFADLRKRACLRGVAANAGHALRS